MSTISCSSSPSSPLLISAPSPPLSLSSSSPSSSLILVELLHLSKNVTSDVTFSDERSGTNKHAKSMVRESAYRRKYIGQPLEQDINLEQ
ncbi:hypothetical protein M378DRAFT_18892 [Amanita muscaria Koide BX008]|uniref:Uncharacterized protein n=1 Tax=Amanita muscaria (strain Koide BX008) TaxID=946122 RepID=A0A0C2WCY0_AMAMK|nr:hypothetical protein M378DRAFT_18892 [Amanita muscaria Koide BX008]